MLLHLVRRQLPRSHLLVDIHREGRRRMKFDPFSSRIFLSRLVVVLLLAYVLASQPPKYIPRWAIEGGEILGLLLLSAAAFGRLWCLVFIAGRKNDEVVVDGPYSVVRNPLYVFSFLGAVGFGLTVENPVLAVVLAIAFCAYYAVIVRREERYLAGRFGAAYQRYFDRTPRWIPRPSLYSERGTVPVITAKMRSGLLDAMWFIWAFMLWEILEVVRPAS
jgi:protein-S-isoprenylcysteine O-methyltransferase Ste14